MKIAIIGAGFYGTYLSLHLSKHKHDITIFEKSNDIFSKNSAILNNQHRLHLGYHYPNSKETIEQTIRCFNQFKTEFKNFVYFPKNNYYLIHKNSIVPFKDYLDLYKKHNLNFDLIDVKNIKKIKNIDQFHGAISVSEGIIDTFGIKKDFEGEVGKSQRIDIKLNSFIDEKKIESLKEEFDLVINCSYNYINMGLKNKFEIKHEFCSLLLIKDFLSKDDCLTIMDGNYASIYSTPYNYHTISSVLKTPFKKISNLKNEITNEDLIKQFKKTNCKNNILKHCDNFFVIDRKNIIGQYLTVKTKLKYDLIEKQRYACIVHEKNYISILPGKISAIYDVVDEINKIILK